MRASAVAALVFANSNDELLGNLTEKRSMASVPFGGRYRLIDFILSNLVNAKVYNVGIITKGNYRSLMDHLGSGIYWDLDRRNGGLRILPPFYTNKTRRYTGYIEALVGAIDFIKRSGSQYIVLCEPCFVANLDIESALKSHIKNEADVTVIYAEGKAPEKLPNKLCFTFDDQNRVNQIGIPEDSEAVTNYGLGTLIFNSDKLIKLIKEAYDNEGYGVYNDILKPNVKSLKIYGYKHTGYVAAMDSESAYYEANMKLLEQSVRSDLFNTNRPIYTKTRDDMPTRYGTKAIVKNSFIADGCVIEGTVKNSVLFRGVKVEKGAVIENSIVMQGGSIGENTKLNYVIADKNSAIGSDMILQGNDKKSFFIKKNQII